MAAGRSIPFIKTPVIYHNGVDCKTLIVVYDGVVSKQPLDVASLAALADFLNTLDERLFGVHRQNSEVDRESLDSPAALTRWLARRGLIDGATRASKRDLARAKHFRRAFRAVLENESDRVARSSLDALVATIPLQARITRGSPALTPASRGLDCALGKLMIAAIIARANGNWVRLKMCAATDCRWVFYDTSKNRLGRWCSMEVCGNRAKTRNYRKRKQKRQGLDEGKAPTTRTA